MALTDTALRTVVQGRDPVRLTLAGTVYTGDPIGYNSGWVQADGNGTYYAEFVAGQCGGAGDVITAYRSAVVQGMTGMTAGNPIYLSDTAGKYSESTGTSQQVVGISISATEAVIGPLFTGTITNANIASGAAIAWDKMANVTAGRMIVGNASNVPTAVAISGDISMGNDGTAAIASGVIVNADVNASAAIAWSKMAALASAHILVGNGSGVATDVAVTGDISIDNTGLTAIASGVIVNADVNASAAIAGSKLAAKARRHTITSPEIDIDNGAGATRDFVVIRPTSAITLTDARVIYTNATTGTVAAATVQLGTSVGGTELVAATNLEDSKAIGTVTALTLQATAVAANTPVTLRHTGIAATAAGMYIVQLEYTVDD